MHDDGQENLLESKMPGRVNLGSRPETTLFSNSRAFTSQFSHLTGEKTEELRGQGLGPRSYSCLVAEPGLDTWSPEARGKFITVTRGQASFQMSSSLHHMPGAVEALC